MFYFSFIWCDVPIRPLLDDANARVSLHNEFFDPMISIHPIFMDGFCLPEFG